MAEEITYKSINDLDKTGDIQLNDYFLISKAALDDQAGEFVSRKATVLQVADLLSSYLSALVPTGFKDLAYKDLCDIEHGGTSQLNTFVYISCDEIVFPPKVGRESYNGYAISSIAFYRGIPTDAKFVNLENYKTKVTNIITTGEEIAKLDGQSLKNGIEILKETDPYTKITTTKLINNGHAEVISPGVATTNVVPTSNIGDTIAVFKKQGESDLSIKNNLNIIPVGYNGTTDKNGDLIATVKFSDHDVELYNNLCVVSKTNVGEEIAQVNGKRLYNGIAIGSKDGYVTSLNSIPLSGYTPIVIKSVDGDVIANIAGYDIYNGVPITTHAAVGEVIAQVKNNAIRNGIEVKNVVDAKGIVTTVINNNGKEYVVGSGMASTAIETKTNVGTVIAEIQQTGTTPKQIKNGIDETALLKKIYPVGSIYLTMSNQNPQTTFGFGTWSRISQGRCLWGSNNGESVGTNVNSALPSLPTITASTSFSGGSATISGTTSSSGSHTHTVTGSTTAAGEHTHSISVGAGNCSCAKKTTIGNSHYAQNWTPTTGSNGSHTHTVSVTCGEANGHTHTFSGTASFSGSGCSTSINVGASDYYGKSSIVQPPAFIVNMWQRVS